MPVTGLKKSGFSNPEKPLPLPRLSTTTDLALSTSIMGMPAIRLLGLSRASGLTTSLAPMTTATSVDGILHRNAALFQKIAELADGMLRLRRGHAVSGNKDDLIGVGKLDGNVIEPDFAHGAGDGGF